MLSENAEKAFSTYVLYVAQTFMMFMCFQEYSYSSEIGKNMLIVGLLSFVPYLVFALILSFIKLKDEYKTRIFRYGTIFGNVGFMGIPFLKMLFSDTPYLGEILIYASVSIMVFNILNWTLGVYLITGNKKEISLKKVALNPVIIAIVSGLLFFVILKKPIADLAQQGTTLDGILEKLMKTFTYLSETVTPLSMTVIGMKLAKMDLKQILLDKDAYIVFALKLVVLPIFVALVIAFLPISVGMKYALFLTLAMPTATSSTLFGIKYNVAPEFASVVVLLSTLLSAVAIPLTFLLFSSGLGVVI
jgi:predicted permease